MDSNALWYLFGAIVLVSMTLDLGVFNRKAHVISLRESLIWTAVWFALACALGVAIFFTEDAGTAAEYATCYLTEYALSIDNLFVFVVLFRYFHIAPTSQHRVLFWGILGALIMRALFIFLGVELVERFAWTTYVLGGFLVLTGIKLAFTGDKEMDPSKNPVLKFSRRFLRVSDEFDGTKFFTRKQGVLFATPMFLCLLIVETTDVLFAVDSVPAALAITTDRFVLYSSNVMAICGLRSLYFAVAGLMGMFRFLQHGLALILVFVGVKMLISHHVKLPIPYALGSVVAILGASIVASIVFKSDKDLHK